MAKKLKHVTLNNWTCHPLRWGNLGKTHPFMKLHLSVFFLRGGFRWKKPLEMFFGFLGIPIFTCPLKLRNPNLQFWRSKLQHMWEIIIKDDKKGNPIFLQASSRKVHFSNKYSHHILLESPQLFPMFLLFILFYSRPRTEASQCHHWLSTLPELWKVIKRLRKMFGTIVRPEFYQGRLTVYPWYLLCSLGIRGGL